ncbi:hypothetical protein Tco_1478625 [Tanacetum coccineum]
MKMEILLDKNQTCVNWKETMDNLKMEMEMEISSTRDINSQDGDPLQDDLRLCLGDDLKKAQDHNQRQNMTQEEAIKTAERAEQEMIGSGSELCEQEMMCSADKYDNRGNAGQAPSDAVPLNYVSPVKEMMRRGKRVLTETNRMNSPSYVRVLNADKDENSDEKKLSFYLFLKMAGNVR